MSVQDRAATVQEAAAGALAEVARRPLRLICSDVRSAYNMHNIIMLYYIEVYDVITHYMIL